VPPVNWMQWEEWWSSVDRRFPGLWGVVCPLSRRDSRHITIEFSRWVCQAEGLPVLAAKHNEEELHVTRRTGFLFLREVIQM